MISLETWLHGSNLRHVDVTPGHHGSVHVVLIDEHRTVVGKSGANLGDALGKALAEYERQTIESRAQTDLDDAAFLAELEGTGA